MLLPQSFLEEISKYEELAPLASALLSTPSTSIRLNRSKTHAVPALETVPWCDNGYYLSERPQFTFDPAIHQGLYYVQDASSMAIAAAVRELVSNFDFPVKYLDACAAPGGKTTAAIESLPEKSLIVANEYDYKRAEILAENIAKWGNPNCVVTRGDTSKIKKLKDFFDIVSVDAPCSGEGMMRKDQQAIDQWSPSLVQSCAATQREIISNVWHALKPGGFLIYSTCTFNLHENEENVEWMADELNAEPISLSSLEKYPQIARGICTDIPCYRFLPGRVNGEGLFIAVVRKPGIYKTPAPKPAKKEKEHALASWLIDPSEWVIKIKEEEAYAYPIEIAKPMVEVDSVLDAILPALHIATIKGKDLIPTQELALSEKLNRGAFPQAEVDYTTAIKYLQKQAVTIDGPKGYVLLTYGGHPLGFVKNLGTRANNLYPKPWRILSQEIPSETVSII